MGDSQIQFDMLDLGSLAGQIVMVTGGTGFIGANLCRQLHRLGARVHVVGRGSVPVAGSATYWQADLSQNGTAVQLIRKIEPSYVFHLSSLVHGRLEMESVLPMFRANLSSTVELLTAFTESGCGVKFVLAGSLTEPVGRKPDEAPSSPYAVTKWACGDYARMFHALYSTPVAIARIFMVYGPGQRDMSKLVPYAIGCAERREPPRIASGRRKVDWIFVDDVVRGLLACAVARGVDGKTIDLGTGRPTTVREVVDCVIGIAEAGTLPIIEDPLNRPLEPVCLARVDDAYRAIGWSAMVDLEEGLRRTVDWYRTLDH